MSSCPVERGCGQKEQSGREISGRPFYFCHRDSLLPFGCGCRGRHESRDVACWKIPAGFAAWYCFWMVSWRCSFAIKSCPKVRVVPWNRHRTRYNFGKSKTSGHGYAAKGRTSPSDAWSTTFGESYSWETSAVSPLRESWKNCGANPASFKTAQTCSLVTRPGS